MEKYYGRELEVLRSNLIEDIKKKNETLTQFTGSDPGMILLDAVCLVADRLNYYIDLARLETYISTCKQSSSLLRIADLTSYFIKGVQPPSIDLEVSSPTPVSFSRKQIEIGGAPYVIITPVVLANPRLSTAVAAYNGVDKNIIVSLSTLDLFDPKVIIGDVNKIPYQGLRVQIEYDGKVVEISKRNWFPSRTQDGKVEIHIRDNRVASQLATKLYINYIEIEESKFQLIKKDTQAIIDNITYKALSDSSPGSGDELFQESKRNIIGSNIQLETLVSVMDFKILAESDLEVQKAIAFDRNTPSLVTEDDKVKIFLKLTYDASELPLSVKSRLDYEVQSKSNILGIVHEWVLAPQKKFSISAKVYTLATDQLTVKELEDFIKLTYANLDFGRKISSGEISRDLLRYSKFIEYVEVEQPTSTIEPKVNEIPILENVSITLIRGGINEGE